MFHSISQYFSVSSNAPRFLYHVHCCVHLSIFLENVSFSQKLALEGNFLEFYWGIKSRMCFFSNLNRGFQRAGI